MTPSDRSPADLDDLRTLKRRVEQLAATQLEALDLFHLDGEPGALVRLRDERVCVGGFANVVVDDGARRQDTTDSLASTARCIRSLQASREVTAANADYHPVLERVLSRYERGDFTSYGLAHLNPFTSGRLLPVLREVAPDHQQLKGLVTEAVARLRRETAREGVSMTLTGEADGAERFPPHGYLTYWALMSMVAWDELDEDASRPSLRWSERQLYRQMALFATENDERSDAYQLGYNLLVQHRFNRDGLGSSLVDLGLRTLFSAQLDRGVWEKRAPLFRFGDRGEAYCFTFDLLSTLLRQFRDEWELLVPYESHLTRAVGWAERNAVSGHPAPLWRSGLTVQEGRPESWATAEVYAFLQLYSSYLTWRIETAVLAGLRSNPGAQADPQAFDSLYQPRISLPDEEPTLLGDLLRQRLLDDLRTGWDRPTYSLAYHPNRSSMPRSGILFGPPGTGKNTYVKRIARYLGWPMVTLDPSDFASEGLPLIATVAADVFAKLFELEDTVIFFDEMEPLMQRRDGDGAGNFEQEFLTTTFIPKLQELSDRAACLFFVATNHYESIDSAVKRPGRFDFRLQIVPPAYEEKLRMAEKTLGEDYRSLEPALREETHRRNLTVATLSEMNRLLHALRKDPDRVEEFLANFRPELAEDQWFEDEARFNSFDRRT